MACPWQTDASSCLSAYTPTGGQYLPTYWPARVPNDVLTSADYESVMDGTKTEDERMRAFGYATRRKWLRSIVYNDPTNSTKRADGRAKFTEDGWHQVGTVTRQDGPDDTALFPSDIWVEIGRTLSESEDS